MRVVLRGMNILLAVITNIIKPIMEPQEALVPLEATDVFITTLIKMML